MRTTSIILGLATSSFALASLAYFIIVNLFGTAFAGLYRMYMYHEEHPYQYIAIVAIVFAILGVLWFHFFGKSNGKKRWFSILATLVLTVLVASIPGGVLWTIHDMQAGFFTEGATFSNDLVSGATLGLTLGWLVILGSTPYNIIGLVIGALLLDNLPLVIYRLFSENKTAHLK